MAPGNTLASFQAALEAGVDMIEFDVLRLDDGRLVLAHDFDDAARRRPLTLEEGLDHFAGEAYAGVELDVDMKLPGYEREVVEGLASRSLSDRALISSMYLDSLDRVAEVAGAARRGWSVPRVRRDYTRTVLAPGALRPRTRDARPAAAPGRRGHRRGQVRGRDGALAARERASRRRRPGRRRAALRLDRRRPGADRPARRARASTA